MLFESIHHIAIIGRNYNKTKEFYVKKLGFKIISEYHRVDKDDIIINVKKENVVLEIFIKEDAPLRPPIPNPEYTGLRHLAFKVKDVEKTLEELIEMKNDKNVYRTVIQNKKQLREIIKSWCFDRKLPDISKYKKVSNL